MFYYLYCNFQVKYYLNLCNLIAKEIYEKVNKSRQKQNLVQQRLIKEILYKAYTKLYVNI